jgi:hypothetical protein
MPFDPDTSAPATTTLADLAEVRQMADAIGQDFTLEGWIETKTRLLKGDDAAAMTDFCRALWAESDQAL